MEESACFVNHSNDDEVVSRIRNMQHCKHRNSFQTSKFIPSIEINKVGFREQRLLGRHDNVKEIPQNIIYHILTQLTSLLKFF